jgi:LEA14-like dessication related protein
MTKARYIILILILISGITSCGKISQVKVVNLSSFRIQGFEGNALISEADLLIKNPTGHKIQMNGFDARIFINNNYLGRVSSIDPVFIKPRTDSVYKLVLNIRMANPLGAAMTVMNFKQGQKINIKIDGEMMVKTSFIKRNIPINEEHSVVL